MGVLRPGETRLVFLTLRNPGSEPVVIERVETSCPCVQAAPVPLHIGAGESALLDLTFDSSDEPDFRGGLDVEVIGLGPGGRAIFQTRLEVSIEPEPRGGR